jgi:hypothetical protein
MQLDFRQVHFWELVMDQLSEMTTPSFPIASAYPSGCATLEGVKLEKLSKVHRK